MSLHTTTISLETLEARIHEVQSDPRLPKYSDLVLEKLHHIKRIAEQLGDDISRYPLLSFRPGCLVEELSVLIEEKEHVLTLRKCQQLSSENVPLCQDYLHGCCPRGVTCNESHSIDDLEKHLHQWLDQLAIDNGGAEVFTVTELFGESAWGVLSKALPQRGFRSLVLRVSDSTALKTVAQLIKSVGSTSLRHFDLSHNQIGLTHPRSITQIAKAVHRGVDLESLSLGYNQLGCLGSLAILQGFTAGSALTALNLSGNGISGNDPVLTLLCDAITSLPSLKKLSLAHNALGPEGCKKLVAVLKTAGSSSHSSTTSSSSSPLELTHLDLYGIHCGDSGAVAVASYFDCSTTTATTTTNNNSKDAPNTGTSGGGGGGGRRLRYLNMGWNRLTFEGVVALCVALESHTELEHLSLLYNLGVGRKGAIAIAEYIKKSSCIATLDLRWMTLGDDGAASVSEAVNQNKSVVQVLLGGNDLDVRTEHIIEEKMKKRAAAGGGGSSSLSSSAQQKKLVGDRVW